MGIRYQECPGCSHRAHPVRAHCPRCGEGKPSVNDSVGLGVVHTFTVVRTHPERAFREATPYVVAIVDLDEGVRILARVNVEPHVAIIGLRVQESGPSDEDSPASFVPVH